MATPSLFKLSLADRQREWNQWISGRLGYRVQIEERRLARRELRRLFGQVVLQVGGTPGFPLISDSLAPARFHIVFSGEALKQSHVPTLVAEDNLLPFPSDSVDILVVQHSLDLSAHPHQVLREIERILRPGGRLLLFGFNPNSTWGLRRFLRIRFKSLIPWQVRFMPQHQIDDWCQLLNLVPEIRKSAVYGLPTNRPSIRRLFKPIEYWLAKKGWICGAVYCLRAKKERSAFLTGQLNPFARLAGIKTRLKPQVVARQRPDLRIVTKTDI